MKQKEFSNIFLILLIIAIIAVGGFFTLSNPSGSSVQKQTTQDTTQTQNSQQSPSTTASETVKWRTYRNATYGIELQYHSTWYATDVYSDNTHGNAVCFGPTKERGDAPEFCVTSVWPQIVSSCLGNLKLCAINRDAIADDRIMNNTAEEKFTTINEYPAYYYKFTAGPSSYTEVEYVLRSQNKIVSVSFRSVAADGTSYESYLSSFDRFLKSIQF